MSTLAGYQLLEQLHASERSLVYRALSEHGATPVIIKILHKDFPSSQDIAQFKREFAIARRCRHACIVWPLELMQEQGRWLMLHEDIGGSSLDKLLREQPAQPDAPAIELNTFFDIALQLCTALDAVHRNSVIHKDINPSNLVWCAPQRRLQIADFGIACELGQETPDITNPCTVEGHLRYMAPEQTGRMNRVVDYRADYYALGATLYELLTGRPPFIATDPMELVHCHIARPPDWSLPVLERLPAPLCTVLQRLLEKNAEQRYQTLHGLRKDLELCRARLHAPESAGGLPGGLSDHSGSLQIPQKLYGRDQDIATLLAAMERVGAGACEMLLVAGYAGIGKSALIHEVHKPIVARRGYFVSGKCDQYRHDKPYASLIQAFQELVRQLLSEPGAQVRQWADTLRLALADAIGVIIELIPELQLVVGPGSPVAELPPMEAENRLNRVFQCFVQVFADASHPLVIFLDDLQWADAATLKLVRLFMLERDERHLLFIGAYRDNEVDASHPLTGLMDELARAGVPLHTLLLRPLTEHHVADLLADTLHTPASACEPLAGLCWQKTEGNPFFLSQFLHAIHEAGHLVYDFDQNRWRWDLAALEVANFTDNVVELMLGKIRRLPPETQRQLQLAACLGSRFDLETLATISGQSLFDAQQELWAALAADFIRPLDPRYKYLGEDETTARISYRFLHDRVQQAAYTLASPEERQWRHLTIGRRLYEHAPVESLEEQLFTIVEHLNAGRALMVSGCERLLLASLNLRAGQKALGAAAYQAALRHMRTGMELLPDAAWTEHQELCYELNLGAAEAACLCGDFSGAEATYPIVLAHCRDALQELRCYAVQAGQRLLQGRFHDAIAIQRHGLRLLRIDIPDDPASLQTQVDADFATVEALGTGRHMADIMGAAELRDPGLLAAMHLLKSLWNASYLAGQPLLNVATTLIMTRLSLQHGSSDIAPFAYASYAFAVGAQRPEHSFQFGTMAVALADTRNNLAIRALAYALFATFVNHWHRHLRTSDPFHDSAFAWALASGDLATVGYIAAVRSTDRLIQGHYLPDLLLACERDIALLRRTGQIDQIDIIRATTVQAIKNLMGTTRHHHSYDDDHFSEAHYLAEYAGSPVHLSYFLHGKIRNAYLFDSPEAEALAEKQPLVEQYLPGQCKIPEASFYAALILIRALQRDPARADAPDLLARFARLLARLQAWAALCPDNFAAKALLCEAEAARYRHDMASAVRCYRDAIDSARSHHYVNLEALGNELCGGFWLEQGQARLAEPFLHDAQQLYMQWGANGKVSQLAASQARRRPPTARPHSPVAVTPTSTSTASVNLDLGSIIKASHALSGEIGLRNVLERLIAIVRENSGAQVARLLLLGDEGWRLEAEMAGDTATVLQARPLLLDAGSDPLFPLSLLRYVVRSGHEVIEEHITRSARFASDPYVQASQPRSVMCLPIKQAAQLVGMLYLENNLAAGSFSAERVEFLRILCVQALISIGHARLHDSLERQIAAHTAELYQALMEQRAIVDNALTGIAFFKQRVVHRCNPGFERMFGYEPGELVGQSARLFYLSDSDYEEGGTTMQALARKGDAVADDRQYRRKDGGLIWCSAHTKLINDQDPQSGMVLVIQDISARKGAEQALEQANRRAEAARGAAEIKSRQLGNLLDNSSQGFLSFTADLRVHAEYSRECERIFDGPIATGWLPGLLYADDEPQRIFLEKNLSRVFSCGEDSNRRDAYLGLLPTEYQVHGHHYQAEYRYLADSQMMLILTDVSDEKALQEKIRQERQRIDFIVNAMENRDDLLDTLDAWQEFRHAVLPALLDGVVAPAAALAEIHREIHTFKGLFAQEGMPSIPQALHRIEDQLAQLIADPATGIEELRPILSDQRLDLPLASDLSILREKLGPNYFASGKLVQLPGTAIDELEDAAQDAVAASTAAGRRLLQVIQRLRQQPLSSLLEPHFKASAQLAARLGRELAPIRFEGDDVAVDPRLLAPFCKSLVHVFRNCVDHGIEDADARLNAGKNEVGRIHCRVRRLPGQLLLQIGDDGCGIDTERLCARALAQGVIRAGDTASMTRQALLQLIFSDGLSTRDQVTEVSGRGIGLAATLHELKKLGGRVDIESTPGAGTEYLFYLPLDRPAGSHEDQRQILDLIQAVAASTQNYLLTTHGIVSTAGSPVDVLGHSLGPQDITVVAGLGGAINILLAVSFEQSLLAQLFHRETAGLVIPAHERDIYLRETVAEIVNVILGHCLADLEELLQRATGARISISPPVVMQEALRAALPHFGGFFGLAFATDIGRFTVSVIGATELLNHLKEITG